MKYDMIIIGAGPAGISAALYAKSRGVNVAVIEKNKVGGIIGNVSTVTHYTGIIQNETGASFAERLKTQAVQAGVVLLHEEVSEVQLQGTIKKVITAQNVYEADTVIIANGSSPRMLDIPGEKELTGRGMRMNAAKDAEQYKGKHVFVVGGADAAIKEAIYLANFAKKVTIIHFEEKLGCIAEFTGKLAACTNVEVKLESRLHSVRGKEKVEEVEILNIRTGETEVIRDPECGIFVYAGLVPNTGLYTELNLEDGYIPVNEKMETAFEGVYAVGDIRAKQVRQVATAVNDGAIAAVNACAYLAARK